MRVAVFVAAVLAAAAVSAAEPASMGRAEWRSAPQAPLLERLGVKESDPVANLSCGIPPIPPIGCKVGPCVCDQNGQNCQWTFICR